MFKKLYDVQVQGIVAVEARNPDTARKIVLASLVGALDREPRTQSWTFQLDPGKPRKKASTQGQGGTAMKEAHELSRMEVHANRDYIKLEAQFDNDGRAGGVQGRTQPFYLAIGTGHEWFTVEEARELYGWLGFHLDNIAHTDPS